MHKQKKIDAGYSRTPEEEQDIQKTNDSRVVRVDGADEDWGSGKHIEAAMTNARIRAPVEGEKIPSECHGMGVYEEPQKKHATKQIFNLGKAVKFYKLAGDPEKCHETKVDHVVNKLKKGI